MLFKDPVYFVVCFFSHTLRVFHCSFVS